MNVLYVEIEQRWKANYTGAGMRFNPLMNMDVVAQAAKAEERVAIVVEETKARNQYSQAIGECEKDISLYRDPTVITYGECVSIIAKYRGWQNFIEDVNLPESIAKPLLVKLDEAIERINQRVLFLETQIFTCEDKVNKATSIVVYELDGGGKGRV